MAWPPALPALKRDLRIAETDDRDDEALTVALDAAVAHVEDKRAGDLNFTADPDSTLPDPGPTVEIGTVRLAVRWYNRYRSPDGLVDLGELGSARIPSVDPDIERMLGIGRYRDPYVL